MAEHFHYYFYYYYYYSIPWVLQAFFWTEEEAPWASSPRISDAGSNLPKVLKGRLRLSDTRRMNAIMQYLEGFTIHSTAAFAIEPPRTSAAAQLSSKQRRVRE